MKRLFKALGALVLVAFVGLVLWLAVAPPELIRVGSGYAAKIVCSNVFVAGRDPGEVLSVDVQAPGNPILRLLRVSVDREQGTAKAGLFGVLGTSSAQYKPGVGCAAVPDGDLDTARSRPAVVADTGERGEGLWPEGGEVEMLDDTELNAVLNDEDLTGEGMRAVVVVKDGRIVGERYAEGFDADTPLLGWSMTKTVNAALVGARIRDGALSRDADVLFPMWEDDERADIALSDMMGMASDLAWNEGYGTVSDVTRMLYLEPDMARFASSKPLDETDDGGIGEAFNYSSGTTVMLSRIWQDTFDDPREAAAYPQEALFGPLGMNSAVLETDARGTFVGSSYLYATARDWARFGQFLLQRGVWEGRSLLPVGYVDWMTQPHPASEGVYGKGQLWLEAPNDDLGGETAELPEDAYFLSGHDGQSVTVIPSEDLVVVRLGLTPSDRGYKVGLLVEALVGTLGQP